MSSINMPKCYVLVGPPGSGKSTWVKNQKLVNDYVYVSTDMHVEAYAKAQGKTYSEVFKEYMPKAIRRMHQDICNAKAASSDIIWDQTNTTVASRAKKFQMLPDYEMIAVEMSFVPIPELFRRVNSRPGKEIPKSVMYSMIEGYQEPTLEEGFSRIIRL